MTILAAGRLRAHWSANVCVYR